MELNSFWKGKKVFITGHSGFKGKWLCRILKKLNCNIKYICSQNGLSGTRLGEKYNIQKSTTDYMQILEDETINIVIITTRQSLHYEMIINALKAGKNIFIEKCVLNN